MSNCANRYERMSYYYIFDLFISVNCVDAVDAIFSVYFQGLVHSYCNFLRISAFFGIQSLRISAFSALPFWCGGSGFCVGECVGR